MYMIKSSRVADLIFKPINYLVFSVILIVCFYPFYYILIHSLSDSALAVKQTVFLWPAGFTLNNYIQVFQLKGLYQAFFVSVSRTVIGTLVTLFLTSILAYTVSNKNMVWRKFFYRVTVSSMYVNAGLIPWYLVMRALGLKDSFLVYILPGAVSAFALILIKTYMEQITGALEESAVVDGAGYFSIFTKIILPVCKPVLAAVAVFTAVAQWNSWQDNLLLVNDPNLRTLQFVLLGYLRQAEAIASEYKNSGLISNYKMTPVSVRVTVTMVATLPVMIIYPLLQKYFISGIMIGSVKG